MADDDREGNKTEVVGSVILRVVFESLVRGMYKYSGLRKVSIQFAPSNLLEWIEPFCERL